MNEFQWEIPYKKIEKKTLEELNSQENFHGDIYSEVEDKEYYTPTSNQIVFVKNKFEKIGEFEYSGKKFMFYGQSLMDG